MGAPTDKREAALAWARRGFKVFPLRPGTKEPMSQGFYDLATNDLEQVRRMWTDPVMGWAKDYNIGVSTDDLIVLDIDMKNGKNGWATYMALGLPLDTLMVKTPTGGTHAYFTGPACSSSVERLGRGLDVRGHHGFVLAPGSFWEGAAYSLALDRPIRAAPDSLLGLLEPPKAGADHQHPIVDLDSEDAVQRAVDYAKRVSPGIFGQSADAHTYAVAAAVKDIGVSEHVAFEILAEHYLPRCTAPRSPDEQLAFLKRKVDNAYAYGRSPPGVADPQVHFEGVDTSGLEPTPSAQVPTGHWYYHGDPWDINVNWLFDGVLPLQGTALLVAPSGAGKTFLAMHLARCVAAGGPFFGVQPQESGSVIYLTSESLYSAKLRLAAIQGEDRLPIALRFVNGLSDKTALQALINDVVAEFRRLLSERHVVPRMIVLDTLSASGLLLDENSNAEAAAAMAALARISAELNVLFLVLHHPSKHGSDERGAGALRNSADYVLTIKRDGNAPVRQAEVTKSRDSPERKLGAFTLPTVVVARDKNGKELVSCTVSMAEAPVEQSPQTKFSELLVDCVRWGLFEHRELIDGADYVELDVVKGIFSERKTGSRAPRAINNAFEGALNLVLETGLVASYEWQGRSYLCIRSLMQ